MTTQTIDAPVQAPVELKPLPAQFEVQVTDEDILLGSRNDGWNCPIARAGWRWLSLAGCVRNNDSFGVGPLDARLGRDFDVERGEYQSRLTYAHDAKEFVDDFDYGAINVEPRTVHFYAIS